MSEEKKLLRLFRSLHASQRETALAFLEFLAARSGPPEPREAEAPRPIPRPAEETVVRAIKRLKETYPMLDAGSLLQETSGYLSQHVMQGRPAVEVIDELEILFARHYERYRSAE
jgi:hypothetical protein